ELEATNFGIMCLTPENIHSPWILFEAGALAKSMQDAKVVPLLLNLEFSEISGPLAQFQAKKVLATDVEEIVRAINGTADSGEPDERVRQRFRELWSAFERKIQAIPAQAPIKKQTRPHDEILEELVTGVRGLESRVAEVMTTIVDQRDHPRHYGTRSVPSEKVLAEALVDNGTLTIGLARKPQGVNPTFLQFAGSLNANADGIL